MAKREGSNEATNGIKILISQPNPASEKSPYFVLEEKYNAKLTFHPFIRLDGLTGKEFRKQKTDITAFKAVIFTSRHAIDHFFRVCEELKVNVSQDTKYFCVSEAVALYLQKFILYRKRKVFFGAHGTNKTLFDVINKHKEEMNFLYVCSENQQDKEIEKWLKDHNCEYRLAFMYRTVDNNIAEILQDDYDIVCFFTPSGIAAAMEANVKDKLQKTNIGTFGPNTLKKAEEVGLHVVIASPAPDSPNMAVAIDRFLQQKIQNKNGEKQASKVKV